MTPEEQIATLTERLENVCDRLEEFGPRLDRLDAFRWQVIGACAAVSAIGALVSFLVH